jgi:formate--tetrahydrofolate ligase
LGGVANGFPREDGFDITVASEVMAVFCLARDLDDLLHRLGRMVAGYTRDRKPVTAADLKAEGAMTVLLRDALAPNLVQTLEGNPAFIHGGPFANIAHGCNSVMATTTGLKLGEYVVTEAGFGADLGAEKFFDIKCRKAKLVPSAAVIVATVRALKMHGGVGKDGLKEDNLAALKKGMANLDRHVRNLRKFGVPAVVAINRFVTDTEAELDLVRRHCREDLHVEAILCEHWGKGSAGTEALARHVVALCEEPHPMDGLGFDHLYPDEMPLWEKMRTIAREIYGAEDIIADQRVRDQFKDFQARGYGHFPICVAKTQYSFSTDPDRKGAPSGHVIPIREVRLAGGAEFLVVICGEIMTMPGLPRDPAAHQIRLDEAGQIQGLF